MGVITVAQNLKKTPASLAASEPSTKQLPSSATLRCHAVCHTDKLVCSQFLLPPRQKKAISKKESSRSIPWCMCMERVPRGGGSTGAKATAMQRRLAPAFQFRRVPAATRRPAGVPRGDLTLPLGPRCPVAVAWRHHASWCSSRAANGVLRGSGAWLRAPKSCTRSRTRPCCRKAGASSSSSKYLTGKRAACG